MREGGGCANKIDLTPLPSRAKLVFPFKAKRMEDDDDAYFTDIAKHQPFRLGQAMDVVGLCLEKDGRYGILVEVQQGKKKGHVPLADLEVVSKQDSNYWPVREYVVWSANR